VKNKYTFLEKRVTSIVNNGNYTWIAFLGTDGVSHLYKVSSYDLNWRYFKLNVSADSISKIILDDAWLYLALDSDLYIGETILLGNPLANYNYITKPVGIVEKAIDVAVSANYIYFLIPGEITGTNAKVIQYSKDLEYIVTVDLIQSGDIITDAKKISVDSNENIWVISGINPVVLTKIVITGTSYIFSSYTLS
jgi:hypothetical protein